MIRKREYDYLLFISYICSTLIKCAMALSAARMVLLMNLCVSFIMPLSIYFIINTVELQWLEHLWDHENMFETGVVRANECLS